MSDNESTFADRMGYYVEPDVAGKDQPISDWWDWRKEREQGLAEEQGWLSLIDFTWIGTQPAELEKFPGTWWVDGDSLNARFDSGVTTPEGEPVSGTRTWTLAENESAMDVVAGSVLAEVAKRGGRYAVRLRDSQAQTLREFDGVPVYPYDSRYVCRGVVTRVEPYDVDRDTFRPDVPARTRIVAELELFAPELPDVGAKEIESVRLRIEGSVNGTLLLNFHDETNGSETADWRFITFDSPLAKSDRESADVEIDFNYALNFPSAFTDFGTCPKPVEGNTIPWVIEAGEKDPR